MSHLVEAVRIYDIIASKDLPTVSIDPDTYRTHFTGLTPEKVLVQEGTNEPVFVILNRADAKSYLESRHALHDIRGDSFRISGDQCKLHVSRPNHRHTVSSRPD